MSWSHLSFVLVAALSLAACGGGGADEEPVPPGAIPAAPDVRPGSDGSAGAASAGSGADSAAAAPVGGSLQPPGTAGNDTATSGVPANP